MTPIGRPDSGGGLGSAIEAGQGDLEVYSSSIRRGSRKLTEDGSILGGCRKAAGLGVGRCQPHVAAGLRGVPAGRAWALWSRLRGVNAPGIRLRSE